MVVSGCSLAQGTVQNLKKYYGKRHTQYTYHTYMTIPLTFLPWYRHFNEKYKYKVSYMGVSDCSLAQGSVQNSIEK